MSILTRDVGIIKQISNNLNDSKEFKSIQYTGPDSALLNYYTNNNNYDGTYLLHNNYRINFILQNHGQSVPPDPYTSYSQIYYQIFVDNLNTKYSGCNSGILVHEVSTSIVSDGAINKIIQIVNASGSDHNIYIKAHLVTTRDKNFQLAGYFSFQGEFAA